MKISKKYILLCIVIAASAAIGLYKLHTPQKVYEWHTQDFAKNIATHLASLLKEDQKEFSKLSTQEHAIIEDLKKGLRHEIEKDKDGRGFTYCECINMDMRFGFVLHLLRDVITKHPDKTKPLVLASFGAGDLFQDYLFVRALIFSGYRKIAYIGLELPQLVSEKKENDFASSIAAFGKIPVVRNTHDWLNSNRAFHALYISHASHDNLLAEHKEYLANILVMTDPGPFANDISIIKSLSYPVEFVGGCEIYRPAQKPEDLNIENRDTLMRFYFVQDGADAPCVRIFKKQDSTEAKQLQRCFFEAMQNKSICSPGDVVAGLKQCLTEGYEVGIFDRDMAFAFCERATEIVNLEQPHTVIALLGRLDSKILDRRIVNLSDLVKTHTPFQLYEKFFKVIPKNLVEVPITQKAGASSE